MIVGGLYSAGLVCMGLALFGLGWPLLVSAFALMAAGELYRSRHT